MSLNGGILSGGFNGLRAPSAPTITGVTTSIGSASVAFTAPSDTGDGAITSYVVTAVDESSGASTGGTGTSSPITVSPPAGGTFKIRMQALNPYGPGRLTEYDTGNTIYSGAELYAWGDNSPNGQLGLEDTVDRSSPVQVGALTNWSQVAAGSNHTASIKTDGTLWTWGLNSNGRLGDSTVVSRSSPVQIGALTNWSQVAAGSNHTAAVKSDGTLWAWGINSSGQLGDGTVIYRSSPVQIGGLTNWSQVSVNSHNLAIKTDGTLWAWGFGTDGRLGDDTVVNKSSPIQVGALTNWSQASAGSHSLAVTTDGKLYAWGAGSFGRLGDGTVVNRSSPVQIGALTNWSQASAGASLSSGAIKTDNTLWTWGINSSGTLGDGTVINRSSPVQVGALTDWAQLSSGLGSHTAAVKTNGTLWTWGRNSSGELGDDTAVYRSSPVQIGALTTWVQVSAGGAHTTALYGVV